MPAPDAVGETVERFLRDIESLRERLAVDLARRNPALNEEQLNVAVQRTLVRVAFLRVCEERGIGPAGCPESLDEPLQGLLRRLCRPEGPRGLADLPSDVLGQVYERSLGKVVRLTPGRGAVVEGKPEAKKAGGVYYTPAGIVAYIVERTVGRLLEGKTPRQASRLRILDPACGAGSVLLGACQHLLDWHLDYYTTHDAAKWARGGHPRLFEAGPPPSSASDQKSRTKNQKCNWRLTAAERRRIVLNSIYGVDIDQRAVEAARLSLLLKLLEGETGEGLGRQPGLPDLASNVKCGNALVGPDFYDGQPRSPLEEAERCRINAFDWQAEFPRVFAGRCPGFDAVIGNPPYVSYSGRQAVKLDPSLRSYFARAYQSAGWPTAHALFIERAVGLLSARFTAFVVPGQVGHLSGYEPLRRVVGSRLAEVRYWGEGVFPDAITPALTFVADTRHSGAAAIWGPEGRRAAVDIEPGQPWRIGGRVDILAKLGSRCVSLGRLVADLGVHTGNCARKLIVAAADAPADAVPVLEGKQVSRYRCDPPTKALRLDYAKAPGEYFTIRPEGKYAAARFVIRQTAPHPIVGPRERATYFRNSLLALYSPDDGTDVRYLVGLLNSALVRFAYRQMVQEAHQRAFPQVKVGSLRRLPIRAIDLSDPADKASHDAIVGLVERMLTLHRQLPLAQAARETAAIQRRIAATDREIDQRVCELYGLTDQDIRIVEQASGAPTAPPRRGSS